MPQSFCQLYGHLIFSTKDRQRWLDDNIRPDIHAYLAGTLRELSCADVAVGGPDDHIHALFLLPKKIAPMTLIQDLKQNSSKHAKTLGAVYEHFAWQRGYALFSVSPPARDAVRAYIAKQVEHHREVSFQDELRSLCRVPTGRNGHAPFTWGVAPGYGCPVPLALHFSPVPKGRHNDSLGQRPRNPDPIKRRPVGAQQECNPKDFR